MVWVGTHVVGPLPDGGLHGHPLHPWASENPVGLGNGTFWTTWHWDPRSGSVARFLHFPWRAKICWKKRAFSIENEHSLRFFVLFSLRTRPGPEKTGCEVDFGRKG